MKRSDWLRACADARAGGRHKPTLANLVAAYRIVQERSPVPVDPFAA